MRKFIRGGRGRALLGALAFGLLSVSGAAAGQMAQALPRHVDVFGGLRDRPADGPGTNILLLGTDSRAGLTSAEKRTFHLGGVACHCSDVMMLVHLSKKRDHLSVLSLPRDSYTEIPGHTDGATGNWVESHPAKLNAAYQEGGGPLAVRTVESMTGVRVDHYVQIDFRRFMDSVDKVRGVDVCTSYRLKDSATKLDLAPGRHHLGGGRSLQYVRSRHVDTAADLGRTVRQQRFLTNVMRNTRLATFLADPAGATAMARGVMGSASVDQGLSVGRLASLARAVHRIPLSRTEFGTVPIGGFNDLIEGVGSTLRWDDARADQLFARMQNDQPLTAADSTTEPADPPRLSVQQVVHGDKLACA
ncbi:LCP family protein [Streptomyces beihaiensis]|uniref:LCP family protein n=1 Tax=Streptomyces beihaiensis TaxID=2984495 RepID=A0ABT3U076_9ACTN|nr:LCP family protein [Streptomyces beihaiensis]MCX3062717.1 LCP family protein [Streptomyces beihaiensis]